MSKHVLIAPSLLSADFMAMGDDVARLEASGADWMHVDVMDGHFVPNITMGVPFTAQLRAQTTLPIDAHLMVSNPLVQVPWFCDAGADYVTFHIEALGDYSRDETAYERVPIGEAFIPDQRALEEAAHLIETIHTSGSRAGVSVRPKTPVSAIAPLLQGVDLVLVMSVEPGFSGQGYIAGSEDKVADVISCAQRENTSVLVQVDGGVSAQTAPRIVAAGADVLVSGNYVLKADDPRAAITTLKTSHAGDARA